MKALFDTMQRDTSPIVRKEAAAHIALLSRIGVPDAFTRLIIALKGETDRDVCAAESWALWRLNWFEKEDLREDKAVLEKVQQYASLSFTYSGIRVSSDSIREDAGKALDRFKVLNDRDREIALADKLHKVIVLGREGFSALRRRDDVQTTCELITHFKKDRNPRQIGEILHEWLDKENESDGVFAYGMQALSQFLKYERSRPKEGMFEPLGDEYYIRARAADALCELGETESRRELLIKALWDSCDERDYSAFSRALEKFGSEQALQGLRSAYERTRDDRKRRLIADAITFFKTHSAVAFLVENGLAYLCTGNESLFAMIQQDPDISCKAICEFTSSLVNKRANHYRRYHLRVLLEGHVSLVDTKTLDELVALEDPTPGWYDDGYEAEQKAADAANLTTTIETRNIASAEIKTRRSHPSTEPQRHNSLPIGSRDGLIPAVSAARSGKVCPACGMNNYEWLTECGRCKVSLPQ